MHTPKNIAELSDLIAWANDGPHRRLTIAGGGQHKTLYNPQPATQDADEHPQVIRMKGFDRIIDISPTEQYAIVEAGVPLRALETYLAPHQLGLGFDPVGYGRLMDYDYRSSFEEDKADTVGGAIASNFKGPGAMNKGKARDHLLGFTAVTGGGDTVQLGGKVVKNVTGFDLAKLVCGAWGTMMATTQLTLRLTPTPPESLTCIFLLREIGQAASLMAAMRRSALAPAAMAWVHILAEWASASGLPGLCGVAVRFDGARDTTAALAARVHQQFAPDLQVETLNAMQSQLFWQWLGEALYLCPQSYHSIWRVETTPHQAATALQNWHDPYNGRCGWLDWGGQLLMLASSHPDDGGGDTPGSNPTDARGDPPLIMQLREHPHAEVWRLRPYPNFPNVPSAVQQLNDRVRHGLDPNSVLGSAFMDKTTQ
ncbi:MAG: FAD-binding oxidoreductase [Alphaproteobacteria bacterium]|nr:FAD-binding oxidoreductase [Alphaproteobacteria bacterium]